MAYRGTESPMEFEYENKKGPVDMRSPFINHQYQQQQFGQQRSFESPSRTNNAPRTPALNMNGNLPKAAPFRNPSFTTPRKAFDPEMFSEASGAESSPADNADAEDTPEMPKLKNMNIFEGNARNKQPIFGKFGKNYIGSSPARGDLSRAKFANALVKQRKKRKYGDLDQAGFRRRSDSSDDSGDNGRPTNHRVHEQPKGIVERLIDGIVARPTLPYVLSYYPQLILNYVLVFGLIYTLWIFFRAIRADVDAASELAYSGILAEMSECNQHFIDNQCGSGARVPAVRKMCDAWEICMTRDPTQLGRAKVSAHTFAEIFNSFVEPISWKAMAFSTIFLVVCITVNNMAFGLYRAKASHPPPNPYAQHDYQWGPVPHPQQPQAQPDHTPFRKQNDNSYPALMPSTTRGRSQSPTKNR